MLNENERIRFHLLANELQEGYNPELVPDQSMPENRVIILSKIGKCIDYLGGIMYHAGKSIGQVSGWVGVAVYKTLYWVFLILAYLIWSFVMGFVHSMKSDKEDPDEFFRPTKF